MKNIFNFKLSDLSKNLPQKIVDDIVKGESLEQELIILNKLLDLNYEEYQDFIITPKRVEKIKNSKSSQLSKEFSKKKN